MPLDVPKTDTDGSLLYYDAGELELIDLKRIGVSGDGDHITDDMSPNASISTRRFSCSWEERYAAALMLTGYAKSYTDTVSGKLRISRLLPDFHPAFYSATALRNWVCTSVKIDPFAYTGEIDPEPSFGKSVPKFKRAHLTAGYELVPFDAYLDDEDILDDDEEQNRYVTAPGYPGANVSTRTDMIGQVGGTLVFRTSDGTAANGPAGQAIPFNYGRMESISTKKIIHRRVPVDCWEPGSELYVRVKGDGTNSNRGFIGGLNLTEFFGIPPLCAQLVGVEEVLLPDPSGIGYSWDLGWIIQEKNVPFGHTGFLWPGGGAGILAESRYYQVGRRGFSHINQTAADIAAAPEENLFHVVELNNLFIVGAV